MILCGNMKSIILALNLTILLSAANICPLYAQDVDRIWKNEAFGVGEWFYFDIDYAFITAGHTEMSIDTLVEVGGHLCYRVVSEVRTNKTFDLIFKVRDRVETNVDVLGIFSRRYYKKLQEGKYTDNCEVIFEQERGQAHVIKKGVYKGSIPIEPCAQDILSSLFYIRTLDFSVGDTLNINLHDVDKSYPLKVRVSRAEHVEVPAGEFDCLVVEPFLESEGMFRSKGKIEIWLTDDEHKIPVLLRTEIAIIGHIDAKLTKYIKGAPLDIDEVLDNKNREHE